MGVGAGERGVDGVGDALDVPLHGERICNAACQEMCRPIAFDISPNYHEDGSDATQITSHTLKGATRMLHVCMVARREVA